MSQPDIWFENVRRAPLDDINMLLDDILDLVKSSRLNVLPWLVLGLTCRLSMTYERNIVLHCDYGIYDTHSN
jgi:hypothetical protein